ncbi:MAG: glycosyltransferase [Bacteroidia bacterium]
MQKQKRILICPLDWGLGHAARCIPIIRLLLKKNAEVIVAADGRALELLKQEFPELEFISLKGYEVNYSANGSMVAKMVFSIPKIVRGIKKEHEALKKIIQKKKIDTVISDNRFGLWNKDVKSVFITHQLMIKTPFAEKLLHKKNLNYINQFDECWIPDVEGIKNLSGDLSHKYELPKNAFYIGALSRFEKVFNQNFPTSLEVTIKNVSDAPADRPLEMIFEYDVMAIISGPEPQRSIFEKLVLEQLKQLKIKALIVSGKTESGQKEEIIDNIKIFSHLKSDEMQKAILSSKIIIARSGYSTIMDLANLEKKAVFIPTPGQTEQEYLAEELMKKKIAFSQTQKTFNLENALKESENYTGFEAIENSNQLEKRIDLLLN